MLHVRYGLSGAPARRRALRWWAVLLAVVAALASFDAVAAPAASSTAAQREALQQAIDSVVGLRVQATEGASSSENLGALRFGSGVVIGPDGLVLTIGYLLLEAERIEIATADGRSLPARALAYDAVTGFGLVQPLVPLPASVRTARLGKLDSVTPGDLAMVAVGGNGQPGSGGAAMTQLVSTRAFSGYWEYHIESALFTSPPVLAHSGAALVNRRGEVVGIGSLFTMEAVGGMALPGNMFVPVDLLRPVLAEMRATGGTRAGRRPWLGLSSSERGGRVEILRVSRESPAEAAGLRSGDVVLAVDGTDVATLEAFYKQLWRHAEPDAEVELTVKQGEETRRIRLRGADRLQTLRKPAGI